MNNQFNLNIKTPCSENFDSFSPTAKGGFCGSCEKEVIDFTKMNSDNIVNYFKTKTTENTCGRFKTQQLQNSYNTTKKHKYLSFFSGLAMVILSFFSLTSAEAQELDKSKKTSKTNSGVETLKDKNNITVKGTVTTEDDGLPLPGASIILLGTEVNIQTDFDGYFEFPRKLKKGDVLIISYVGMESKKIIIENKKSASTIELELDMLLDSCVVVGEVAVKEIFKSKRN